MFARVRFVLILSAFLTVVLAFAATRRVDDRERDAYRTLGESNPVVMGAHAAAATQPAPELPGVDDRGAARSTSRGG